MTSSGLSVARSVFASAEATSLSPFMTAYFKPPSPETFSAVFERMTVPNSTDEANEIYSPQPLSLPESAIKVRYAFSTSSE